MAILCDAPPLDFDVAAELPAAEELEEDLPAAPKPLQA
jgi:hypothetical protein